MGFKNNNVSSHLKLIVNYSREEAELFGDSKVRPEHILLSLIHCNDFKCMQLFEALNIDTPYLYDRISDSLLKSDLYTRIGNKKNEIPFSSETKLVFRGIDKECEYLKSTTIDTTHLLLAILALKSPLTQLLNEMGITYMRVKKCIKSFNPEIKNGMVNDGFEDENPFSKPTKKVTSKTVALDNFCRDISKSVKNGEVDKVVGRKTEIKRVAQILSRRRKNSPVLIGVAGSGKTAIVEGLAQLIESGDIPRPLIGKRILSLDLAAMVAGTKYRGQFEERMKVVMEECRNNRDVILFIDELHTMVGAGNSSGSMDASNILKPALSRGEIQIIGATTLDEYRENIEKDGALTRRFQQVLVTEPTLDETIAILTQIKDKYEKHHNVKYTDEAIEECVKLADRYIMERAMPDKAIDVMDESGSATNMGIEKSDKVKQLEIEKERITKKKIEVVAMQIYEDAAKLRDEEKKLEVNLAAAINEWNNRTKEPNVVDVALVSEVVSTMTGIPLAKISVQEKQKLINLEKDLQKRLIGQDNAINKVVKAIKRSRIGIKDKNKPIATYIFLGPSGVGKTELAKLLAEYVYGDKEALIRMDMSEYMEKFSVSRLVGPPPGYVGYEQGGQLTEKVRRKPYSVILFDEIEKANEDVFNILLQLFDEGQLTDGLGRKVNFKNTLIILTSNVGVSELQSFGKSMGFETTGNDFSQEEKNKAIIDKALKKKFKPEFLNRIDEAIVFNSLSEEDIHKIIYCEIEKLEKRLSEIGFTIKLSKSAVEYIAKNGYNKQYGARPLTRAIMRYVEDPISDEILNGNLQEGDTIKITYDPSTDKMIVKSSKK